MHLAINHGEFSDTISFPVSRLAIKIGLLTLDMRRET